MEPKWLTWAKQLQAIAQAGLEYSNDKYDIERFQEIRELSVDILDEYTDVGTEKISQLFCNESGYQTPKVDVRGVVFKDDKILLIRESDNGLWSLPGGWAEFNLSIKENVVKEVREESGLNVSPVHLIALLDKGKHVYKPSPYGIYKAFVLCQFIDGEFQSNIETLDSGFFPLDGLPELCTDRTTYSQIEMCFNAHLEKTKLTIFD